MLRDGGEGHGAEVTMKGGARGGAGEAISGWCGGALRLRELNEEDSAGPAADLR